MTTRPMSGLHKGYKPKGYRPASKGTGLDSSPPFKGYLYYLPSLKGSSYSLTLDLSMAISCFSRV